ncbi:MAG: YitT family protein, partial [Clostridia bacterium]|nr:YitT family protein [Clostridia bacterium]
MKINSFIRNFSLATLGSISFAIAVAFFYDPYRIAAGGVTGFAVIISHIFPVISTGTVALLINIPLLILAFFRFGKKFAVLTVYATMLSSMLMNAFEPFAIQLTTKTDDLLVPALCGGMLDALGLGLVYRAGGCTGGTDVIIKFLRQKLRHIRTGGMSLAVNLTVIIATFLAFKDLEIAAYSAIAIVISSVMLDKVLYGGEGAKLIFIISDNHKAITNELLTKIELGVTLLDGVGAYTRKEKKIILCAVKKQSFTKLREIVKATDPNAFMIISSATEIFGEGYKS